MANYSEFKVKITDENGLKKLQVDSDDLRAGIKNVVKEVDDLNGNLVNLSQKSQVLRNLYDIIGPLSNGVKSQGNHAKSYLRKYALA